MPNLLDDLLTKKRTEDGSPFGSARSAETSSGTAKCDQILRPTVATDDPGANCKARLRASPRVRCRVVTRRCAPTSFEVATGLESEHGIVYKAAPEAIALLEAILPRTLDLVVKLVDKTKQRRSARLPGTVRRGTGSRQKQGPPCLQKTPTALRAC